MAIDFPILLDPGKKATLAWDLRVLPASFLVSQSGAVRYSVVGDLDWGNDMVVRWVSELLPAAK